MGRPCNRGFEPLLDYQNLQELARRARTVRIDTRFVGFERRSDRSGRVPMEGVVGRLTVADLAPPLVSLLAAAEWIHVGKQSTFGFGRISLRVSRSGADRHRE